MKKGFTLVELLVVLLLFTGMFAAIFAVLATSDRSFKVGQNKFIEQREARKALDNIARLLRQSNPDWVIGGTHYPLAVSEAGKRVDFYQPIFDSAGEITGLKKITFKVNPDDATQLLKKEGSANSTVVATHLEDILFTYNSPVVTIEIKTKKENTFTLKSTVTLRNQSVTLPDEVEVEAPQEGEF